MNLGARTLRPKCLTATFSVLGLAICGRGAGAAPTGATVTVASQPAISATGTKTPIKHVIVIVMENRSFDNLFHGFAGADSVNTGLEHTGRRIALRAAPFEGNCDPDHSHEA